MKQKKDQENIIPFKEDSVAYYEEAMDACAEGDLLGALDLANDAVRVDPTCVDNRFLQGEILYEMGLYEEAADINLAVLALDEDIEESYFYCMRALVALGRKEAAFSYLEKGISHGLMQNEIADPAAIAALTSQDRALHVVDDEEEAELYFAEAERWMRDGFYEPALETLSRIPPASALFDLAVAKKSDCYCATGRAMQAKEMFDTFMLGGKETPLMCAAAANVACVLGEFDFAREYLQRAVGAQPDTLRRAAQAEMRLGRFREAAKRLDTCLYAAPYDRELLLLRASCYANTGARGAASDLLAQMLILHPNDTVAMYWNGELQEGRTLSPTPAELPQTEIERRIKLLYDWSDQTGDEIRAHASHYLVSLAHWAIVGRYLDDFETFALLAESEEIEFMLREVCVAHDTPWDVKRLAAAVLCFCVNADILLRIEDSVQTLDCREPAKIRDDDFLMRAWCWTLATLGFSAKDYEKDLRMAMSRLAGRAFPADFTERQLAATAIIGFILKREQVFFRKEHDGILSGLISELEEIAVSVQELIPVMFPSGKGENE